jgi:hypothetical protein
MLRSLPALLPALLILLFATPTPAHPRDSGSQRVSVDQLEDSLSIVKGKTDAEMARALTGLELTERLSPARFEHLKTDLPGGKARQQLQILADRSAFLAPPNDEIPKTPAPEPAALRQMMSFVVEYVSKTVHKLPDFLATRETIDFEDQPREDQLGSTGVNSTAYQPLHMTGRSSIGVVYRDGREQVDRRAGKDKSTFQGLVTSGEFGPILSTILVDAVRGTITWSHWEQGEAGPLAVFHYEVPKEKSHYLVQFCCVGDEGVSVVYPTPFREIAGFQGDIAFDPASGKIMRMSAEAELPPSGLVVRAAILVEYGPVEIGGVTYNCPQKSVSILMAHIPEPHSGMYSAAMHKEPIKTYLNDVAFGQYQVFGSEARILNGKYPEQPAN